MQIPFSAIKDKIIMKRKFIRLGIIAEHPQSLYAIYVVNEAKNLGVIIKINKGSYYIVLVLFSIFLHKIVLCYVVKDYLNGLADIKSADPQIPDRSE